MKKETLFKETPFNGYKRDDVINYITELDTQLRDAEQIYEKHIKESSAELNKVKFEFENLNRELTELKRVLDEKQEYINELNEQNKNLTKSLEESREMAETLYSGLSKQMNDAAEYSKKLEDKDTEYKKLEEYAKEILNQNNDLKSKNEEYKNSVNGYIIKISEQDALIEELRKKDAEYSKYIEEYLEIKNNIDSVLDDVIKKAEEIKQNANREAVKIIEDAKKERSRILNRENIRSSASLPGNYKQNISIKDKLSRLKNELIDK